MYSYLWNYRNNDVNNQDATNVLFINLFKSAQHVSRGKFAHPKEHFLTACTAFGTMHRNCCRSLPRLRWNLNRGNDRQQCRFIVPKAVYTVKTCSWGWANMPPETCWADLKRIINEKVVASCWLFTSLYWWCTVTQTSYYGKLDLKLPLYIWYVQRVLPVQLYKNLGDRNDTESLQKIAS